MNIGCDDGVKRAPAEVNVLWSDHGQRSSVDQWYVGRHIFVCCPRNVGLCITINIIWKHREAADSYYGKSKKKLAFSASLFSP